MTAARLWTLVAIFLTSSVVDGQPPLELENNTLQWDIYRTNCNINYLSHPSNKIHCQDASGESVSCLEPTVVNAYIQCESGYFNVKNITQMMVFCQPNGTWTDQPFECLPKCNDALRTLEPIETSQLKLPTSYVEIVPYGPEGVKNLPGSIPNTTFPALILNEHIVLMKADFLSYFYASLLENYAIKIHKSNGKPVMVRFHNKFAVTERDFSALRPFGFRQSPDKKFIMAISTDLIAFDEDTQPICDILQIEGITPNNTFEYDKAAPVARRDYLYTCIVPRVDAAKIAVKCFSTNRLTPDYDEDCSVLNRIVVTRCEIGYRFTKNINIEYLSMCFRGQWRVYGDYSDCVLECGKLAEPIDEKASVTLIYKGNETESILHPWHVGIYANNTDRVGYQQVCGGSIIRSNIVISAGHCFYDSTFATIYNASSYAVRAGKRLRRYEPASESPNFIRVLKISTPFNFQMQPLLNDIAVLFLEYHYRFTTHIQPICIDWLTLDEDMEAGIEGQIVGWGSTSMDDVSSSTLLTTQLTTIENEVCEKLAHPNQRSAITDDRFCGINKEQSSACKGDSGGGYVIQKKIGGELRYVLAGVVSEGLNKDNYCSDGFITLFTNVQFHKDFIKNVVSDNIDQRYKTEVLDKAIKYF